MELFFLRDLCPACYAKVKDDIKTFETEALDARNALRKKWGVL